MIGKLLEPLAMLANEECKRAREEYGEKYSSPHEGFGILCEEVQEAEDEVKAVRRDLSYLLRAIRHGEPMDALPGSAGRVRGCVCEKWAAYVRERDAEYKHRAVMAGVKAAISDGYRRMGGTR